MLKCIKTRNTIKKESSTKIGCQYYMAKGNDKTFRRQKTFLENKRVTEEHWIEHLSMVYA